MVKLFVTGTGPPPNAGMRACLKRASMHFPVGVPSKGEPPMSVADCTAPLGPKTISTFPDPAVSPRLQVCTPPATAAKRARASPKLNSADEGGDAPAGGAVGSFAGVAAATGLFSFGASLAGAFELAALGASADAAADGAAAP